MDTQIDGRLKLKILVLAGRKGGACQGPFVGYVLIPDRLPAKERRRLSRF